MNITQQPKTSRSHRGLAAAFFVATLCLTASSGAQVLFRDTFTVSRQSLDVNFEIPGARQTGTLVGPSGIPYVDTATGGDDFKTQVNEGTFPQALFILPQGGPGGNGQYVSPNFNFNSSGANLQISVLALNQPLTGGDLLSFKIGQNGPLNPIFLENSGFGILLRPQFTGIAGQNNFEIYSGTTVILSGNSAAINGSSNLLSISLSGTIFDGSPTGVNLQVNGTSLFAGTIAGGFGNNFITMGGANFGGGTGAIGFDNLTVQIPVPEPATYAFLALGAAAALIFGKRARAFRA